MATGPVGRGGAPCDEGRPETRPSKAREPCLRTEDHFLKSIEDVQSHYFGCLKFSDREDFWDNGEFWTDAKRLADKEVPRIPWDTRADMDESNLKYTCALRLEEEFKRLHIIRKELRSKSQEKVVQNLEESAKGWRTWCATMRHIEATRTIIRPPLTQSEIATSAGDALSNLTAREPPNPRSSRTSVDPVSPGATASSAVASSSRPAVDPINPGGIALAETASSSQPNKGGQLRCGCKIGPGLDEVHRGENEYRKSIRKIQAITSATGKDKGKKTPAPDSGNNDPTKSWPELFDVNDDAKAFTVFMQPVGRDLMVPISMPIVGSAYGGQYPDQYISMKALWETEFMETGAFLEEKRVFLEEKDINELDADLMRYFHVSSTNMNVSISPR